MAKTPEFGVTGTLLWDQMSPEWRASMKMNGCVTNPCLVGDAHCHCWVAAQRAAQLRRLRMPYEPPAERVW